MNCREAGHSWQRVQTGQRFGRQGKFQAAQVVKGKAWWSGVSFPFYLWLLRMGFLLLHFMGFALQWLHLALGAWALGHLDSVLVALPGLSCSTACVGILGPDQGVELSVPCTGRNFQPLDHQGSPDVDFFIPPSQDVLGPTLLDWG